VETEPADWINEDLVWDDRDSGGQLAIWFLNDIYNYVPNGFNRINGDFLDAASGDAIPSRINTPVESYTNGQASVILNPDPYWANSYFGIRKVNTLLANLHRVPFKQTVLHQYMRAEARFLRALFYFELLKRYGGVPLIGDRIFTLQDNLEIPRNTFAETVDYIASECTAIRDSLRPEPIPDGEWGRVPRGAAIALKCRVFLYAASPLYNGGGIATDPVKRALMGYPTADPTRWQKVLDAVAELKALNYYALLSTGSPTPFASVFTTKKNIEVIFAKQTSNNTGLETSQSPVGYNTSGVVALGLTSPTQEFVEAFPMANGLPINATGSGFNPARPYTGRDPRLTATVFFNDTTWLNRRIETFEGGLDKPNKPEIPVQTRTGYYLRKFLGNFATSNFSNTSHNFIHFRYAEILLNEAEALNEMGMVESAVTQIIAIRRRAGIIAGTNNRFGIPVGITQDDMRLMIRNERRLELAFEEHRFWDVRRWKIAPQVLNGPVSGIRITKTGSTLTYQVVPVSNLVFQNRLYHMPIPYDEVTKNTRLIQNEGW
jgi:hypothetical protein